MSNETPVVGVIMGSDSDWSTMRAAAEALTEFGVAHEVRVLSAHRTPEAMLSYAREAADQGLRVIIAGAGGAAMAVGDGATSPAGRSPNSSAEGGRAGSSTPELTPSD